LKSLEIAARLVVMNVPEHSTHAELHPAGCVIRPGGAGGPIRILCSCGKRLKISRTQAAEQMKKATVLMARTGVSPRDVDVSRLAQLIRRGEGALIVVEPVPKREELTDPRDLAALASPLGFPVASELLPGGAAPPHGHPVRPAPRHAPRRDRSAFDALMAVVLGAILYREVRRHQRRRR